MRSKIAKKPSETVLVFKPKLHINSTVILASDIERKRSSSMQLHILFLAPKSGIQPRNISVLLDSLDEATLANPS